MFKANVKNNVRNIGKRVPSIYIGHEALLKINIIVNSIDKEIGWLGSVATAEGVYIIDDVYLFEQEVNGATTEITPEGLSSFAEDLIVQDGGVDKWNSIKLWGHSHVNMSVSPSGQDDKQMELFESSGHDFFIRMIANQKGDIGIDLFNYKEGLSYEGLDYSILYDNKQNDIIKEIERLNNILKEENENKVKGLSVGILDDVKKLVKEKETISKYSYGPDDVYDDVQIGRHSNYYSKSYFERISSEEERKEKEIAEIVGDNSLLYEIAYAQSLRDIDESLSEYGYISNFDLGELMEIQEYAKSIVFGEEGED